MVLVIVFENLSDLHGAKPRGNNPIHISRHFSVFVSNTTLFQYQTKWKVYNAYKLGGFKSLCCALCHVYA